MKCTSIFGVCFFFFVHMCVSLLFFKQCNGIVDQSVCGLKGWPWCWAYGSVLRVAKGKPSEAAESTVPTRRFGITNCFHLSDSHYIHVSIIFPSSLFWKLVDLRQLCFLLRTPRFKQLQILFQARKFQLEKSAEHEWQQATEWLRKQQCVPHKEKGKNAAHPSLFHYHQ